MENKEKLYDNLVAQFNRNGFTDIPYKPSANAQVMIISPVSQGDITDLASVEFFLVEDPLNIIIGAENLRDLVETLINYDNLLIQWIEEVKELKSFYDKHKHDKQALNDYCYSDWHKDLFGYRPKSGNPFGANHTDRLIEVGVIAKPE